MFGSIAFTNDIDRSRISEKKKTRKSSRQSKLQINQDANEICDQQFVEQKGDLIRKRKSSPQYRLQEGSQKDQEKTDNIDRANHLENLAQFGNNMNYNNAAEFKPAPPTNNLPSGPRRRPIPGRTQNEVIETKHHHHHHHSRHHKRTEHGD